MARSTPHRAHVRLPVVLFALLALALQALPPALPRAYAAPTSGSLRIEPIAAYNFVVDSNVLAPSTYAPEAGTLGAKVCNDSPSVTLTDVSVFIGDYDPNGDSNAADSTPGVYPVRTNPAGLSGAYSLTHEGGSAGIADASRFIPALAPGQCALQYWLVSYPRTGASDGTIVGAAGSRVAVTLNIKPDDDLFLFYDMWAAAGEGGVVRNVDVSRRVTMRNEISAAANKIWPNTTSKVPQAYLDAIATALGWQTFTPSGSTVAYPGQTVTTQGIWYDLGNVGFGFDNNFDGVPDQNAWVQPIGDPNSYDPGCFRLVRSYGVLIVKLKSGGEQLIPFVDQLYFEAIPENTGVVGLVYYQYAALDGACSAGLSPYQEVASGYDNEKFSGDYGFGIPPLQSRAPAVSLSKGVSAAQIPAPPAVSTLNYTISFQNTANAGDPLAPQVSVGDPSLGVPLVINDAIPAGSDFVLNSATAVGASVSPAGVRVARVRYSTDGGATWTTTQPAVAASVTNLQWWMDRPVPQGDTLTLGFSVTAPQAPPAVNTVAVIPNTATASFGTAPPFAEASARTLVQGSNAIAGTVYQDTGAGALFANNALDGGETGRFANVAVQLFLRTPEGDILWGSTASDASGAFSFGGLPDGDYEVVVDKADADITTGWTISGPDNRTVLALGAAGDESRAGVNFGFAPPLGLAKTLVSASPAYEGDLVTFNLAVSNRLPGDGTASLKPCVYEAWAGAESAWTTSLQANKKFTSPANAAGAPDDLYAVSTFANAQDFVSGNGFTINGQGNITKVEVQLPLYTSGGALTDDSALIEYAYEAAAGTVGINTAAASSLAITPAALNARNGVANKGTLTWDITSLRAWSFADFANAVHLRFSSAKTGGVPAGAAINLDAIGLKITTDALCGTTSADTTIDPAPLTDTYDADLLQFVSAGVQPTTATVSGTAPNSVGTLTWANVGPLYPGGARTIPVTFRALQPAPNPVTTPNDVAVSGAKLVSGRAVNGDTASASVQIQGAGSIGGRAWSNPDNDWVGATGYEAGELGLPGVTARLFACQVGGANFPAGGVLPLTGTQQGRTCTSSQVGGTWVQVAAQATTASGDYRFTGLRPGFYYVDIDTATVPGGVTNNAERDTAGGDQNGTGRGGAGVGNSTWGALANALTDANGNPVLFNFLSADEDIANVSFGYPTAPVIYGAVWQDYNGNAARESVDGGIGVVTVRLCTAAPCTAVNAIATTTTDSAGAYRFAGLNAGATYYVAVATATLPAGSTWTQTAESDGTPLNNQITVAAIAAGAVSGSHDFGFTRGGALSIGDTLYYDWDGDAAQDANEEGVRNVTVYLYEDINNDQAIDGRDALVATTATDQAGKYSFANRAPGNYYVVVDRADPDLPAAFLQTQDPDEAGRCVTCNSRGRAVLTTTSIVTQDFGYMPAGTLSIGDTVWYDANGDGAQAGAQERGLPNVGVALQVDLNGDGTFVTVRTAVTDAQGAYRFGELPPGAYRVVVDAADADIPDDSLGANYAPSTPTTRSITLSSADDLSADFGFTALAAIGDTVYYDTNGNGQQDYGEPGIAGVTVTLANVDAFTAPDGTAYAAGAYTAARVTDAGGRYLFGGLPAIPSSGSGVRYTVSVAAGAGTPINGRPQTADPDRDGESCASTAYPSLPACDNAATRQLFPGTAFMGADFGYRPTGVLGDTVWVDADDDGVRDAGEYGIPYVTVRVVGPGCPGPAGCTRETDPNGEYAFAGLADGSYTVSLDAADPDLTKFTAAQGLVASYEPSGTLDNAVAVTLAGGVVSQIDGAASPALGKPGGATSCATPSGACTLVADFGFRFFSPAGFTLSGTVCLDGSVTAGACGATAGTVGGVDAGGGEQAYGGETVFLYRWADDGDGVLEGGETVLAATATTTAAGDYSFAGLPAATGSSRYLVSLAAPADSLVLTTPTAGLPSAVVRNQSTAGVTVSAYRAFNLAANLANQDFAFAAAVATQSYDFGDLPASYSTTLQGAPDGARHSPTAGLYLGAAAPDLETNGAPTAAATGDGADEDGVSVPITRWLNGAGGGQVTVQAAGSGYLIGWIDWGRDGGFGQGGDMVLSQAVSGGTTTYQVNVPAGYFPGGSGTPTGLAMRFRLFAARPDIPALAFSGLASGGEVEDYLFNFTPNPVTLTSFGAARAGDGALVEWATASELDVAGFHLLRSATGSRADAVQITAALIPASGDSLVGGSYRFADPAPGADAGYWLVVVHSGGVVEEYGPARLSPGVAAGGRSRVYLPLVTR